MVNNHDYILYKVNYKEGRIQMITALKNNPISYDKLLM